MSFPRYDVEQAKRELTEFLNNPGALKQFSEQAMNFGFFVTLDQARIKKIIGPALFAHEYRRYYDLIVGKIEEGETELRRLEAALRRMKAIADQGRNRRHISSVSGGPDDAPFQEALRAFQGWVVSLYETYLTICGYIVGAQNAQEKVRQLASASWNLMQQRKKDNNMASKHAELFNEVVESL